MSKLSAIASAGMVQFVDYLIISRARPLAFRCSQSSKAVNIKDKRQKGDS